MDYVILHNGISLSCRNHYNPAQIDQIPEKYYSTTIPSLSHRCRSFLFSFLWLFQLFQDWIFFFSSVQSEKLLFLISSSLLISLLYDVESPPITFRGKTSTFTSKLSVDRRRESQVKIQRMPICFERKGSTINAGINSPWLRDTK